MIENSIIVECGLRSSLLPSLGSFLDMSAAPLTLSPSFKSRTRSISQIQYPGIEVGSRGGRRDGGVVLAQDENELLVEMTAKVIWDDADEEVEGDVTTSMKDTHWV